MNRDENNQTNIRAIVIDLTNVLFLVNVKTILQSVGIGNLIWYVLTKWKNPETACLQFLDALHNQTPDHPYPLISYKSYKMPDCITANLLGLITTQDVWARIQQAIAEFSAQHYFYDNQEERVLSALMKTMFNLDLIKQTMEPNERMINLIQSIKNKSDEYKFFLLTNVGHDTYRALSHGHPEVFALFDGAILSADVQELKPYPPIYQSLLDTYQLSPETSVFIDDQEDNIEAALALGFNGIVYRNHAEMEKELAKLGITQVD